MGRLRTPRVSQPQGPTSVDKRVLWAFLPLTTSSNYISFEGGSIRKGAVSSPVPSTAIGTGRTGPLRGIKPAANTGFVVSVALPAAELNAAFAATGAGSVLIVCKSQSAAGHGSSVPPIFALQSSGSSWNHYPYTDGNIYVGPLSATRYLNGTVSGATAGIYDPHVAIATAKSGAQRFYVNGILRGSGSAAETPALNTTANTSGLGEFGSVYLVVFFDYVLSDSEIKAYSANPWQLFAPDARRIWVPVAAGGDSTITQADGTSTTGSLGGSATAATTPAGATGTSTAASIAASATAAAAVTQADGASTASTLGGSAVNAAVIAQADAATTASTLTGAGLTAGASSITAAAGTSAESTLAGSSVAASTVTQADGVSTAGTLTGTDGIAAASIFPASGSSTASDFAASATAASVAIAAAGASSAATMAGSDGASTFTGPARTRIGAVTLHAKTTTMTLRATNARIGSLTP